MNQLLDYVYKMTGKPLDEKQVKMMNPLVLAYLGDTVYDLFIRTTLVCQNDVPVHQLHVKSISFVKAAAQSDTLCSIERFLTEDEKNIVRRGRNAKSNTIPKNADMAEYKRATGFESLIGYLYLTEQEERLFEILGMVMDPKKEDVLVDPKDG